MASRPAWAEALEAELGCPIASWSPVAGGDLAESHRIELRGGDRVFLKHYGDGCDPVARAEAEGLQWLDSANALRTPRVLASGERWLALEWIENAKPRGDWAAELGEGLAALHSAGAASFGFPSPNWLGPIQQDNRARADWATFYGEARLRPMMIGARASGDLPADLADRLDDLIDSLSNRIAPLEGPSRLHGDLWSGNVMVDERGAPCLIDPAVYGGHPEIDLAMMRLFGGFSDRTFAAYHAVTPLPGGAEERVPLYQLYPLLVHVRLFGASYVPRLATAIQQAEGVRI